MSTIATLWVSSFDNTYSEWQKVGQSPYLDAIDYPNNYVVSTTGVSSIGFFLFENIVATSINSARLELYLKNAMFGAKVKVFVHDGTELHEIGEVRSFNAWSWKTLDVTNVLNTPEKVNNAKVILQEPGAFYYSTVDAARLIVEYVSGPSTVTKSIDIAYSLKRKGYSLNTLDVQADSYVDEGNLDTNYGQETNLKVLKYSETLDCYAYLQATFPSLAIFSSTVKFYWNGTSSSLYLEPVKYFDENEITWNNRPVAEASSSIIVVSQGWNEISLDFFYAGKTRNRISLRFGLREGNGGTIYSRESENKPVFIVEGYTIPHFSFVEKLDNYNTISTLNFYCQNRYSGRKLNICVCPTDRDVSYYSYWKHISLIYDTLNTSGTLQNVKVKAIQDKTIIIAGYKEPDIGCPLDQYDEAKGNEYSGFPISSHSYYDSIVVLDTFYSLDSRTFNLENPFTLKMLVTQCSFDYTYTTTKGAFETYPISIYKYHYLGTIVFQGEYIPEDSTFDVTYELPYSLDYTCLTIPIEYVPHKTIQLALQFDTDIPGGTIRVWDSVASSLAESQFLKGTEYSNYKSLLRACIVAENVDPESLEGTLPSSWDTLSPQSEEYQLRGTLHELTFGSISAGKQVRIAFKLFGVEDLHLRNSPCKFELEILPSPSSILANISPSSVYWIPVEEIYFTGEYTGFRRHTWAKEIEFDFLQVPSSGYNSKASLWFKYPRSVDL